jgi:protein-tyrosine-phosphatase
MYNVLFLCTGNSARSIMAEAILNREGIGKFKAFSAGSQPRGAVHPYTADLLSRLNYDVSQYRSKTWDEFAAPDAPVMDFVFTVCDQAAAEVCPLWPGATDVSPLGLARPCSSHWKRDRAASGLFGSFPNAAQPLDDFCQPADQFVRQFGASEELGSDRPQH